MEKLAVSFLSNQLSELLSKKADLLWGLEPEVRSIRDEMLQVNELLRGFVERDDSSSTPEWIVQLQDIAFDAEDAIDKYMLQTYRPHDANGVCGCIKEACASINDLILRYQTAFAIQEFNCRLTDVSTRQQKYSNMNASIGRGSSSSILTYNERYDGRSDALFLGDDEVVGIEKPKKQLVEWISSRHEGLEVISVVGMGGLGKTTLVKKVYDDESVKIHFNHHVWLIALEYKDDKSMLTKLINKLVGEIKESPPQELESMSIDDMREFIFTYLQGKKYIIVLDDVWDMSKWEVIRPALPKSGTYGCVIITTRYHNIARNVCSETNHVYELQPLPENKSWELFYNKAFTSNPCPDYLRGYAEKILRRCQGLPLAISIVGGLLATKGSHAEEWDKFERSLGHELKGGGSLEKVWKSLIALSYNDLPYYLKYCYLYLSIFPEDSLLEKETIIRLWVAEGFVQPKQDRTMEEVAVDYLGDLLSRSLIQVAERGFDGRARAFRIHDLLRDFIISMSREHNIVTISNGGEMQLPSRVRRLEIQKPFRFSQDRYNLECLRSLILLCSGDMELDIINELVGRCKLLKVLELRGALLETIPNDVFKLYYLKHMSLRNTMVKVIPKSIKYLVNLETLDLKHCNVTELPKEILELHRLQHLLAYHYQGVIGSSFDYIQSCEVPCDIGRNLPLLIKLRCIDANESDGMKIVREVRKLTQLRRLGITKLRSEDGKDLCSSIAKLTNLRSLTICSIEEGEILDLDHSIRLPFLRMLELNGCIEKVPKWIRYSDGLTRLILTWSRLREDPLNNLQDLPHLAKLYIHGAYVEGLRFNAQGFKKLKELWLEDLKCMKWVIVEKGSMPSLKEWYIRDCKLVRELPQGIEHLPHLEDLDFGNMEEEFVKSVVEEKRKEGVHWRLSHVTVSFYNLMDDGTTRFELVLWPLGD